MPASRETFYYLDEFLAYFSAVKERSDLTIREYTYDLQLFFRWYLVYMGRISPNEEFEDIDLSVIDLSDLKAIQLGDFYRFFSWLANERGVGPAGRARKVSALRAFFDYLTNKAKVLDINPTSELESPKQMRALPQYLDIDEARSLLAMAAADDGPNASRDYCILVIFLTCGIRLSELVGIDLSDINGDSLRVIGKGNKERQVYLNQLAQEAIEAYLPERLLPKDEHEDALFVSRNRQRISQRAVENVVEKYLLMAGLDSKRYSPHKLRHTAATLMYQYGEADLRSLQQILGHESVATTEIYTHVSSSMLRDTIERHPLNTLSKEELAEDGERLQEKKP